jgi:hypothetical protein
MLKSKIIIFICIIFCFGNQLVSQHQISKYELCWAFFHPIASIKIKRHLPNAMIVYHEVKSSKQLDTIESGGKLDAFRHTFTMAYLSHYVKVRKLRKLGKAHEKGNQYYFYRNQNELGERADSLACEMDLRNNEQGFLIGTSNRDVKIEELKEIVLAQIKLGNAWYLKKNNKNEYISCNNEPINLNNYKNVWFVPKCLIRSNE